MNRGWISNILRTLEILYYFDWFHFIFQKIKYRRSNWRFKKVHPEVKLPPDYLLYESFQLNYRKYYYDGIDSAIWLAGYLSKYKPLEGLDVLDWGCGPGRIIRHMPGILGKGNSYYGTDYNQKTIDWCRKNLPGIDFNKNTLEATLPYDDNSFDFIYGISVFTHLSEEKHFEWAAELFRILKPDGILFVTTQGRNFVCKLTSPEKEVFEEGAVVIRAKVKEGHRTFSAFQPARFMQKLFEKSEILDHIEEKPDPGKGIPQDIWIIKKSTN
jgi:SAM-dependent methyltransferase